jgi:sulfite reductase alpha subunit-like flavoprotein
MNKFWSFLLIRDLPPTSLQGLSFSVFGLGDSKYVKFNYAARRLRMRLL